MYCFSKQLDFGDTSKTAQFFSDSGIVNSPMIKGTKVISVVLHAALYIGILVYTVVFLRTSKLTVTASQLQELPVYVWIEKGITTTVSPSLNCSFMETYSWHFEPWSDASGDLFCCKTPRTSRILLYDTIDRNESHVFVATEYFNLTQRWLTGEQFPFRQLKIYQFGASLELTWVFSVDVSSTLGAIDYDISWVGIHEGPPQLLFNLGEYRTTSYEYDYQFQEVVYLAVLLFVAALESTFLLWRSCRTCRQEKQREKMASHKAEDPESKELLSNAESDIP
jgi:hypothetical protein